MKRHLHPRRAGWPAPFRWSRIPVESRGHISAVEYRLFDTDEHGTLHREHLLVTDSDRSSIARAVFSARRRLRDRVAEQQSTVRSTKNHLNEPTSSRRPAELS